MWGLETINTLHGYFCVLSSVKNERRESQWIFLLEQQYKIRMTADRKVVGNAQTFQFV